MGGASGPSQARKEPTTPRALAVERLRRAKVMSLLQEVKEFPLERTLAPQLKLHNHGPLETALVADLGSTLQETMSKPDIARMLVDEVLRMEEVVNDESVLMQETADVAEQAHAVFEQSGGMLTSDYLANITAQLPRLARRLLPRVIPPHLPDVSLLQVTPEVDESGYV